MANMEKLCEWLSACGKDDIPSESLKMTKAIILDALACACLGAGEDEGRNLQRLTELEGAGPCSVIGGNKTSLSAAAFINACLTQIHDGNDGFVHGEATGVCCHPGRLVVPASLALGEALGSSGAAVMTAIAATFEAINRMRGMDQHTRDISPAAIVSAKLLNLSSEKISYSLGFAFHNALMRTGFTKVVAHEYFTGIGTHVRNGVNSALLAHNGFRSGMPDDSLFVFETDRADAYTDALYFKPYTACRNINAAADLLLTFRGEASFDIDCIEKITVYLGHGFYVGNDRLETGAERMQCQLNIYYSLAAAMHDGVLGGAQYSSARRNDSNLHEWSRRIDLKPEKGSESGDLPNGYARVEICLKDGTLVEKQTDYAKWGMEEFPSDHERHEKFRTWSSGILSQQKADQLIGTVENLEKVDNIGTLANILRNSLS
jgi:2-methylcitrate dehydratase PrpD